MKCANQLSVFNKYGNTLPALMAELRLKTKK